MPLNTVLSWIFLSTPSVGRATPVHPPTSPTAAHFYPRPPWGGRPSDGLQRSQPGIFLSTPSVGRATHRGAWHGRAGGISIHALRGEGDSSELKQVEVHQKFLSTPSVGRATSKRPSTSLCTVQISIHALRGEGDMFHDAQLARVFGFLSTPSVGRATQDDRIDIRLIVRFLSTPSVGRATKSSQTLFAGTTFLSTPSVGRATLAKTIGHALNGISIHALRGEGDSRQLSKAWQHR